MTEHSDSADRRFRDLRDSGYDGPIDQDGHPVDDLDQWITDHRPN